MRKIKVTIEKGKDLYGAYSEEVPLVYGCGWTIAEVKQSTLTTIQILKKYNSPENLPAVLFEDYELEWCLEYNSG